MPGPDIAVIINSFNRLALLQAGLTVLTRWIPKSELSGRIGIVVYDAGSTDGSIEWLRAQKTVLDMPLEVLVPTAGGDTSFAAGLNAGVTHAEKTFSDLSYLLFYETDNQILEATPVMQALAQLQNQQRLAACGFTVRQHNGAPTGVGQPFPTLLNFAAGKNVVYRFDLEAIPYRWQQGNDGAWFSLVDVVFTSPLLVRLTAWQQSGGLDAARFPFSDCDVDWARRLRTLNWRLGVVRTDAVIHDNLEALSAWSKTRALTNHRGRLRYFRQHRPLAVLMVWPGILLLRHALEWLSSQLLIKDIVQRKQLAKQFSDLFLSCINSYRK